MLYRVGITPWNSVEIPGPLAAEVRVASPGIAVDLGCGTGRQARHLAANGWSIIGVDFVPRALAMAAAAAPPEVDPRIHLAQASTRLR